MSKEINTSKKAEKKANAEEVLKNPENKYPAKKKKAKKGNDTKGPFTSTLNFD